MRDDTKTALKVLRASKKLEMDRAKFGALLADIRAHTDDALWAAITPASRPKKPVDPLADHVKRALAKYRAPANTKAERLVAYMMPDRDKFPKTMAAALKLLRQYFPDPDIAGAADEVMAALLAEGGMTVTLDSKN